MKILITGTVGFIGMHLSKKILDEGHQVFGIDNINDYYDVKLKLSRLKILKKYKNFTFCKADITSKKINSLFRNFKPQIVLHLAAQAGVRYSMINPSSYVKSNIDGFFNIIENSKNNNVQKFLFASSSSVYGYQKKSPFKESFKVDKPLNLYAATKLANENLAYVYNNLYDLNTIGLRFFTVYGPFGRPDMSPMIFTDNIIKNKEITLNNEGKMIRDFTYIDDVVFATYQLLIKENKSKSYNLFNIGSQSTISVKKFISIIEKNLGKKALIKNNKFPQGEMLKTHSSTLKLKREINYSPKIDINIGVQNFIKWYKDYYSIKI